MEDLIMLVSAKEMLEKAKAGHYAVGQFNINNLSRTAASLELKEITADRNSPIGSMGSGSHKVWVKRKE